MCGCFSSTPTPPSNNGGSPCPPGQPKPCPKDKKECWPKDYEKEISTPSYGRYSQPFKKDGTKHGYTDQVQYKIYVPAKSGSDVTVEVRFKVEKDADVTDADVTNAKSKLEKGVKTYWDNYFTLEATDPECPKKTFKIKYKVVWADTGQHYTIKVHKTYPREGVSGSDMNVSKSTTDWTYAHEFAHCVGLPDEYSYTADTETVKYFKPDGTLDAAISAPPDGKSKTAADATIMSAVDNTIRKPRHAWNIAIEVRDLLTSEIGRKITTDIK